MGLTETLNPLTGLDIKKCSQSAYFTRHILGALMKQCPATHVELMEMQMVPL
jgi:hypothetical protein